MCSCVHIRINYGIESPMYQNYSALKADLFFQINFDFHSVVRFLSVQLTIQAYYSNSLERIILCIFFKNIDVYILHTTIEVRRPLRRTATKRNDGREIGRHRWASVTGVHWKARETVTRPMDTHAGDHGTPGGNRDHCPAPRALNGSGEVCGR